MSVTQSIDSQDSQTAPTLTNVTQSLELALAAIDDASQLEAIKPIASALELCLLFTAAHHLDSLTRYIKQELEGYQTQPPRDRLVKLNYFDVGGQAILGLEQYQDYPLTTGIRKLESHLKNGLTLMLPRQITSFLSQAIGRQVESGHVSPSEIKRIIFHTGNVVRQQLVR